MPADPTSDGSQIFPNRKPYRAIKTDVQSDAITVLIEAVEKLAY
jgi:hypothetical protein